MKSTQRAHILIPGDLLREIDALVGPRGRSAFLLETARQEVRRRKLLRFLDSKQPAWAEDHPELESGAAAYVQQLRRQSERREAADSRDRTSNLRKRHLIPRRGRSIPPSAVKPRRSK